MFQNRGVCRHVVASALVLLAAITPGHADEPRSFNSYILAAVNDIGSSQYARQGYDSHAAFTHALPYGANCCVVHTPISTPPNQPLTMCVAAVEEVILWALKKYYDEDPAQRGPLLDRAPMTLWNNGTSQSIKANLFLYKEVQSRGTGDTLERFGLGAERHFSELQPGDFVNLNRRNGTGHATVFLDYIDTDNKRTPVYSPDVIGFVYFSAQGQGKPVGIAGLDYRWAYFEGHCPEPGPQQPLRDCGVIRSNNLALLDGGTMYVPADWTVIEALQKMKARTRGIFQHNGFKGAALDAQVEKALNTVLPDPDATQYDESSTD